MENVNRNHKNSVFSSLFSTPDILRELYSAIEGIPIPPDIPIDINTLSNVLFMNQINDVSFLIDKRLVVLIEHQSTINENLPYRLLEYVTQIYKKIVDKEKKYQKNLMKIPKPEFIVLYNGTDDYPDYTELKLSDAFMDIEGLKLTGIDKIPLELIVLVYNINHGHNPEILKKCESLYGYSFFINKIREYKAKGLTLEESVNPVIEYCIKNNILKEYLEIHASEVINMIFGEYDREMDIAVNRREAREEGLEEGEEIGMEKERKYFLEMLNQDLTKEEIKERLQQEEKVF
jgi:hypothetical protein